MCEIEVLISENGGTFLGRETILAGEFIVSRATKVRLLITLELYLSMRKIQKHLLLRSRETRETRFLKGEV